LDAQLADAISRGEFRLLVLSRPLSPSSGRHQAAVRPVQLRDGLTFQWTTRQGTQERHENLAANELIERVRRAFGVAYGDAHLFTDRGDFTVRLNGGEAKWKAKPPSKAGAPPAPHNRPKNYLIPEGKPCPFLHEIGVMTAAGQVRASQAAKFRQINRYLEFIEDILPALPADPIRVVDFGCGKSYLTFALHYLLTEIHRRDVQITGLDLKEDVIAQCSAISRKLNCAGLEFRAGDIASFSQESRVQSPEPEETAKAGEQPNIAGSRLTALDSRLDLAISLHACDTATDDALAAAIDWGCRVVLAAPCCQHEIHQRMSADAVPGLTEFGLFRERFAAMATDALRAQFLDACGYKTQVLEFIETEHTPKNVLLRAVLRKTRDAEAESAARQKLARLKELLGIETWRLEERIPLDHPFPP
jgi:SAM-dependent methyltransferase